MITLEDIRACAMALPAVEEKPHFGTPGFRVQDKLFASVHPDDAFAIVHVSEEAARAAAADDSETYELVWRHHGGKQLFVGLRIDLTRGDTSQCRELVEAAWRHRAPKRLIAGYDQSP